MRKVILFLIALFLIVLPASAATYTFSDTAGHDYYAICANASDYRPSGYVYGFDYLDPDDENYIPNSEYDTFVCYDDDSFEYVDFHFKPESSIEVPVTFWYPDGQKDVTLSVTFQKESSWIFWFTESMTVQVLDSNSNVLLSDTQTNVFDEYVRFSFDGNSISVSQIDRSFLNDYYGNTYVNVSMSPLTAMTFDLTDVSNTSSYCVVKVIDDSRTPQQEDLPGWIQWLYNRIDFMDPDMVLYNALIYIVFMWDFLTFLLTFMVFSTWSYFILANCVGLFYGILQSNKGYFAMLEGYCKGMYYSFLLPIRVFKFLVSFFLSIVSALLPI